MTFLERYSELGQEFEPAKVKVKNCFRINNLKIEPRELLRRLNKKGVRLRKIAWLELGYEYESKYSLGATPEYLLGYYYLQDAASQTPVQLLKPNKKDLVLDMCAAPGGKTTQLAQYMNNEGAIIALDTDTRRLLSLRNNLERMTIKNVLIYRKDARFVFDFGLQFDKVLLDAPCSGNFTLEKDWFEKRSLEEVKERARRQKELLKAAVNVLKKGGTLVYSTCSLEPEENELNIDWLLRKYPGLKLEETGLEAGDPGVTDAFGKKLNTEIKKCKRFWPHKTGTQGFFVAKIHKP
jgi:NOL1/NOP2/sun family putative RNA methylase